jgi:inorganic pyrophosphatase
MWIKRANLKINYNDVVCKIDEGKLYFYYENKPISPWHDIELKNDNLFNMIVEIPKWTRSKMEIQLNEPHNPIVQDIENNLPREYKWGDMLFNYGILPQTYENPHKVDEITGIRGDGDPIDIIDIGILQKPMGSIYKVKILGVLPMIDQNETDWKIIGICNSDPLAFKLNDIDDVQKYIPGMLDAIKVWFQKYKLPTKGIENGFHFDNYGNKEMALQIIDNTNSEYLNLI